MLADILPRVTPDPRIARGYALIVEICIEIVVLRKFLLAAWLEGVQMWPSKNYPLSHLGGTWEIGELYLLTVAKSQVEPSLGEFKSKSPALVPLLISIIVLIIV